MKKNEKEYTNCKYGGPCAKPVWHTEVISINFFTAFPNYQTLLTCYNFLNPGTNGENIAYVSSVTDEVNFTCVSSIESTYVQKCTQ